MFSHRSLKVSSFFKIPSSFCCSAWVSSIALPSSSLFCFSASAHLLVHPSSVFFTSVIVFFSSLCWSSYRVHPLFFLVWSASLRLLLRTQVDYLFLFQIGLSLKFYLILLFETYSLTLHFAWFSVFISMYYMKHLPLPDLKECSCMGDKLWIPESNTLVTSARGPLCGLWRPNSCGRDENAAQGRSYTCPNGYGTGATWEQSGRYVHLAHCGTAAVKRTRIVHLY